MPKKLKYKGLLKPGNNYESNNATTDQNSTYQKQADEVAKSVGKGKTAPTTSTKSTPTKGKAKGKAGGGCLGCGGKLRKKGYAAGGAVGYATAGRIDGPDDDKKPKETKEGHIKSVYDGYPARPAKGMVDYDRKMAVHRAYQRGDYKTKMAAAGIDRPDFDPAVKEYYANRGPAQGYNPYPTDTTQTNYEALLNKWHGQQGPSGSPDNATIQQYNIDNNANMPMWDHETGKYSDNILHRKDGGSLKKAGRLEKRELKAHDKYQDSKSDYRANPSKKASNKIGKSYDKLVKKQKKSIKGGVNVEYKAGGPLKKAGKAIGKGISEATQESSQDAYSKMLDSLSKPEKLKLKQKKNKTKIKIKN